VHLEWDDLEPRVRSGICVEVGTEEEIGRRPGKDLESDLHDFIAWRYEVLHRGMSCFPHLGQLYR
jgi:hypothetical protein